MPKMQLGSQILTAFKQAVAEDRLDVADHLLRALETLSSDRSPGSPLADAYFAVALQDAARPHRDQ